MIQLFTLFGINNTWTHSMHAIFFVHMVHTYEGGKLMLYHPLLTKIESQLSLSGLDEYHKKNSIIVIKKEFYMGSCSYVTPLLRDGHFF